MKQCEHIIKSSPSDYFRPRTLQCPIHICPITRTQRLCIPASEGETKLEEKETLFDRFVYLDLRVCEVCGFHSATHIERVH